MENTNKGLSSFHLHMIAMAAMLCDHLWGTFFMHVEVLGYIGRLAFPIFAFLLTEGFFHTRNRKRYLQRMALFALISEIPFNLMMGRSLFYPLHQNVLLGFTLGILMMNALEKHRNRKNLLLRVCLMGLTILGFFLLGILTFTDYYGYGLLMICLFYFIHDTHALSGWRKWLAMGLQLLGMYWINCEMMQGLVLEFELFGIPLSFHKQGLALLALIPIWLYNGSQGPYNRRIRQLYYWFYPVHMLILGGGLVLYYL